MKNELLSNLWFLQVKGCWLVGGTPYWGSSRCISLSPWMRMGVQPPKFGLPEISYKQQRELLPPGIFWNARKQTFFSHEELFKYQVCWGTVHNNHLFPFFSIQMVTLCSQKIHFTESKFYHCIFLRTNIWTPSLKKSHRNRQHSTTYPETGKVCNFST